MEANKETNQLTKNLLNNPQQACTQEEDNNMSSFLTDRPDNTKNSTNVSTGVIQRSLGLANLETVDWDLNNVKTGHSTHSFHPYPAKFIPQIPSELIKNLSNPGDTVGDIFCGSGTTLVEALSLGRNTVGIDANPLACLISTAKTTILTDIEVAQLNNTVSNALIQADEIRKMGTSIRFVSKYWRPNYEKLDFWFYSHVIEELAEIHNWCKSLPTEPCRNIALTSFSAIIVAVSKQDSDTRYVRREKNIAPGDTFKRFARVLAQNTHDTPTISASISKDSQCTIVCANLLDAPAIPKLDLMVCSPPYPNAFSYHLYHMTRMIWLGMDQPKFKKEEIGSHRKYSAKGKNAATVETFKSEFSTILSWLSQNLRVGGYACFVVGDSTLRGERINNADLISEIGCASGFIEDLRLSRTMQATKKAFNPVIGKIKKEDILIMKNIGDGQ